MKLKLPKLVNKWSLLLIILLLYTFSICAVFALTNKTALHATPASSTPTRIIAAAPNLVEILFALQLQENIVGVPIDADFPPEALQKPKIGSFWQPNIEAIIAAQPDLVITLAFSQQKSLAHRLDRIGCSTLTLNIEKVEDLFNAIKEIGAATNSTHAAEKLLTSIKAQLFNISTQIDKNNKPKVLWVVQRNPLRVAGTTTFVNEIIQIAGGKNAIGPTPHKYPPIGAEIVYACAPDVIIEPAMGKSGLEDQQLSARNFWAKFESIPAVKNSRIYVIDGDTVSRLGPRLHIGARTVANCLRPQMSDE